MEFTPRSSLVHPGPRVCEVESDHSGALWVEQYLSSTDGASARTRLGRFAGRPGTGRRNSTPAITAVNWVQSLTLPRSARPTAAARGRHSIASASTRTFATNADRVPVRDPPQNRLQASPWSSPR
jgi:hypothetical protein